MNPYKVVSDFENAVAEYLGSKYAVAVDSCTNAIFLCCKYNNVQSIELPSRTYPSVPCSIIHAGGSVSFRDYEWRDLGFYQLSPYSIYDAAHLFRKGMYGAFVDSYVCISFSATKPINIGKGGMILTNDEKAIEWFKQARYCGRHEKPLMEDSFEMLGWNMYMTPEQAARGILLMNDRGGIKPMPIPEYPDLSKHKVYHEMGKTRTDN